MARNKPSSEEDIFKAAVQVQDLGDRDAYVLEACCDDERLLANIRALLRCHDNASFLDSPALEPEVTFDTAPLEEGLGTVIGRYKLLKKIGQGGMAVVYEAEQREPLRRRVALKIIKLGMDTKQVIARFEAERQALAMMDHPNIAKVFDAGATETGRPYFVMERVAGVSITEYCDRGSLSTPERLDLFAQVCSAVQHAHQKGIIHRDIKPSNVLVTNQDGQALPKVIDFGIAKATNQRLTEKTLLTRCAQIIGTPAYMSPEQAEFGDSDVDTRTDIYSLGILLYELLTGSPPFGQEQLHKACYLEMQRLIRDEEPAKPSTKLGTLGQTLRAVADRRRSTPDQLRKTIRGDLDWIVMKSLEKDRWRRYDSASLLLEDIQRHLRDEPVSAGPPSPWYRTRKYLQRHRALVTAVAATLTILVVGLVVSLSLYIRMRAAFHSVAQLETKIDVDEQLTTAQRLLAQGRHSAALQEIDKLLETEPVGPKGRLVKAQALIELKRPEEAQAELASLTQGDPEIAATAHYLLARANMGLDETMAKEHEALAASMMPESAEACVLRAMTARSTDKALAWLDQAIALDPSHYTARKARTLIHYSRIDDDEAIEDVAALIALRPDDSLGYALRAVLRRDAGRLEAALVDHDKAVELSEGDAELAEALEERHATHLAIGDYALALADARRVAELHPDAIDCRLQILMCLLTLEDYEAVRQEYRSIVQTHFGWDRYTRVALAWHVFGMLNAGHPLSIPPEIAHRSPFRQICSAMACYEALSKHARGVPTRGKGYLMAGWLPNGKELLCGSGTRPGLRRQTIRYMLPASSGKSTDVIVNTASGDERPQSRSLGRSMAWSHDAKHIAYSDPNHNLCIVPAAGGRARTLLPGDSRYWTIQWSHDDRTLYFKEPWRGGYLCSLAVNDPDPIPTRLLQIPDDCFFDEGRNWALCTDPKGIDIVDVTSGESLYRHHMPWPVGYLKALAPSGRELFFANYRSYVNTGALILDTQDRRLYKVFDHPVDQLLWSHDGSQLAIGACRGIWVMDVDPNVPVSQYLGQEIPEADLTVYTLDRLTDAVAADPDYPENYLERALLLAALGRKKEAQADMEQFHARATPEDHHIGHELFWWLWQYTRTESSEAVDFLTPHAERFMERFPDDVPSCQYLIRKIIRWNREKGHDQRADRWRARLKTPEDQGS